MASALDAFVRGLQAAALGLVVAVLVSFLVAFWLGIVRAMRD